MDRISDRKKLLIFINIMISGIATSMLSTAMSTALPAVIEYYGVSLTIGQWEWQQQEPLLLHLR